MSSHHDERSSPRRRRRKKPRSVVGTRRENQPLRDSNGPVTGVHEFVAGRVVVSRVASRRDDQRSSMERSGAGRISRERGGGWFMLDTIDRHVMQDGH